MEDESKQIDELKELVRRNIALTQDTNKMVHAMRRSARWGSIIHWGWWIIITLISAYLYFSVVQPYVDRVSRAYEQTQAGIHQAQDWQTNMSNFFKNLFGG